MAHDEFLSVAKSPRVVFSIPQPQVSLGLLTCQRSLYIVELAHRHAGFTIETAEPDPRQCYLEAKPKSSTAKLE